MRWPIKILLCLLLTLPITGCEPEMSSKDMGMVNNEIPKVQGADKPYEMPKLDESMSKEKQPDKSTENK